MIKELVFKALPFKVQNQLDALAEVYEVLSEIKDPAVLRSIGPAGIKGLLLHRGKQGKDGQLEGHGNSRVHGLNLS